MEDQKQKAMTTPTGQNPANLSALGYFQPEMLEQALRVSEKFYKAGCFGADVKNAEQVFVKIQAGAEMGLPPMEAMNSLYLVNGHLAIWGKALAGRLKAHGWEIEYSECDANKATVRITKNGKAHEYTAKKEEVQSKQAYKIAPENKLKYHALRQLINFYVPEALGAVAYTVEEVETMPAETSTVQVVDAVSFDNLVEKIGSAKTMDEYLEVAEEIGKSKNIFTDEEIKELRAKAKAKKAELESVEEVQKEEVEELKEEGKEQEQTTIQ